MQEIYMQHQDSTLIKQKRAASVITVYTVKKTKEWICSRRRYTTQNPQKSHLNILHPSQGHIHIPGKNSPRVQMLCFDCLGAVKPWSWPAGGPVGGSTCTCPGCSGPLCSPYTQWQSSRCSLPCRPPADERSGSRSHPVCSYRAETLCKPGRATGATPINISPWIKVFNGIRKIKNW